MSKFSCVPPCHHCDVTRYLQRLSEDLCHNLRLSNRATSQSMEAVVKREQANVTIATLQPQYTALVARTKKLQSQVWGHGLMEHEDRGLGGVRCGGVA